MVNDHVLKMKSLLLPAAECALPGEAKPPCGEALT